jgi:branched-chain amino acid transport system permease protein
MRKHRCQKAYSYGLALLLIVIVPIICKVLGAGLWLHILFLLGVFGILSSSLNLLMGFTGQVSICHAAIYGIGAYTSAILVTQYGFSFWLALPIAGISGAFFGFLIGYPSLRLRGIYFSITTFAFSELNRLVIVNLKQITKGNDGIPNIPAPTLWGIEFVKGSNLPFVYLTLGFALLTIFIIDRLSHSRSGRAFIAIREDEVLAASIGVNLMQYKVLSFMIASFFAGIAGSFYAHGVTFISPEDFNTMVSINILAMVVLGGMSTLSGPFVGSAILLILPTLLRPLREYYYFIFGFLLILVIVLAPSGSVEIAKGFFLKYIRPAKIQRKGVSVGQDH